MSPILFTIVINLLGGIVLRPIGGYYVSSFCWISLQVPTITIEIKSSQSCKSRYLFTEVHKMYGRKLRHEIKVVTLLYLQKGFSGSAIENGQQKASCYKCIAVVIKMIMQ